MSRTDIVHQVRLKLRVTETIQKGHIWPKSIKHLLCISSGTECCGFRCVTVIMQRANYRRRGALRALRRTTTTSRTVGIGLGRKSENLVNATDDRRP